MICIKSVPIGRPNAAARLAAWPRRTALTLLLCAVGVGGAMAQSGPQKLPAIRLTAGIHNINAEVAQTPEQRSIGLMFRTEMGTHDGMLFIFERAGTQCFWMRNTLIPLQVAFIEDDGRIVNLEEMQPRSDDSHCSTKPVRFVLEMNTGWFSKRGLKPGDRISGAPFAAVAGGNR